ncbi:MAG: chitobiase/beta-hexosaminidase C-terminal domain-containing protein [Chthoniobacterales bacterium]
MKHPDIFLKLRHRIYLVLLLFAINAAWSGQARSQDVTFQTVAITGAKAPNTLANVNYLDINAEPWLTDGTALVPGRALVLSRLGGPGVAPSNEVGLWEGPIGNLTLLARKDDGAPGTASSKFFAFDGLYRNSSGGPVVFGASLSGATTGDDTGIWFRANPQSLSDLILREGSTIPGFLPNVEIDDLTPKFSQDFESYAVGYDIADTSGTVFIEAESKNAGPDLLIGGIPGDINVIAYEGGPANGVQAGITYLECPGIERFVSVNPLRSDIRVRQFNATAQLTFRAALTGIGVTANNDTGIWSGTRKNISLFAREGDPASGPSGGVLSGVSYGDFPDAANLAPVIAPDQTVTFTGSLIGTGVGSVNNHGIWAGSAGDVPALLLRSGTQAPGTANGVQYSDFTQISAGSNGWLFFQTVLVGGGVNADSDDAIYAGKGSSFQLVARENFTAPGTNNAVFKEFNRIEVNNKGFIVFTAKLNGTNITPANDEGIWIGTAGDPTANPVILPSIQLMAREGDPAPDTQGGIFYGANFFDTFLLNQENEVVVSGTTLSSSGATSSGIWARNQAGNVVLVARQGAQVPKNTGFGTVLNDLAEDQVLLDNNGGIEFPVTFSFAPVDNAVLRAKLVTPPKDPAAAPAFSPAGGSYTDAQTITLSSVTPEAGIRYTTDGSPPNSASTLYTGPFLVTSTTTVRAFAFKDGFLDSAIVSAIYEIGSGPTVATPTISPSGGTFAGLQTVTMATSTQEAMIFFTLDGSNPTTSPQRQLYVAPFSLNATTTVRAVASKADATTSAEASALFFFTSPPTPDPGNGDVDVMAQADVDLSGKRRTKTEKRRVVLRGSAESADGIDRVEYTVNGGKTQKARGTVKWRIPVRIKPDKNARKTKLKIEIYSYSKLNVRSEKALAVIIYKPKKRKEVRD